MLVTITDFATERNVDRDTVNAFIRNHPEIQKFVSRQGKNTVIDTTSEGYEALDKKYPLPQMVQVIEDTESRAKLIKAQELIIQLQEKLTEQQGMIAKVEAQQLLLDKTEKENSEMKQKLDERETDLEKARNEITQTKIELAEKENNVEQERKRAERAEQENAKFKKTIFGLWKRVE